MRCGVLALCSGFVLLGCNTSSGAQGYSPDLAVSFDCSGNVTPALETKIEKFLTERAFTVANLERVRRQYGQGFYPLEMEAYDNRRWTVRLISFRDLHTDAPPVPTKTEYNLGVYSPPPTHHDDVLEKDFINLVTQQLKCEIRSSNRYENEPGAVSYYDHLYSLQMSRDHEAEICDKTAKTYDADQCRKVPGIN